MTDPHTEFIMLTQSRYSSMRERVAEKRSKTGLLIRVGRQLGFTCEEYREWIRKKLGGEQGYCFCFYCNTPIDIHTLVTDHMTPLAQGGALDLGNLCACCQNCNDQKGALRAQAFMQLLSLANNTAAFSQTDRTDLLGRLQSSLKLAKREQQRLAQRASAKQTVVPHTHVRREAS